MKRLRGIAVAITLLLGAANAAAQSTDITGDWDLTLNSPQGARTMKASFKQAGEKLSGSFKSPQGELAFEGTVTGKVVKFTFTVNFQGNPLPITLTGQVDGNAIKGDADFGGFAQGDWNAARADSAAAGGVAPPTPAAGPAGDWDVMLNSPTGSFNFRTVLQLDGDKLTGTVRNPQGELALEGTATGNKLKFTYTVQFQGNPLPITMTGQVDGDSAKGDADFGGFAQGDWSAKRAAPGAPLPASPAAAPASGSGALDVSGTWAFAVETSAGSGNPTFTFKQEGEKLTGHYKGALGEADVTGTVKGNTINFSFKISAQGAEGTVTYTGTVEGDAMKGSAVLGELGSGTFTAKKQ